MLAVNRVRRNCFKIINFDFAGLVGQMFKFDSQELSTLDTSRTDFLCIVA